MLKGERHKGDLVLGFEYFYNHGNVFRNIINRDRKTEILIKGKKETQRSICFFLGEDIKKYIDDLNLGSDVTYERLLDILNSNKPWKYPYHK